MSFEDDMLEAGFHDENEYLESLCSEAARWLSARDLHSVNWLPADEMLLPLIEKELSAKWVVLGTGGDGEYRQKRYLCRKN